MPDTSKQSSRFVWALPEIHALPEFGNGSGWFYGLVRDETGLHLCEIFGSMGYAYSPPRWYSLREWWMALQDIWQTPVRKTWVNHKTNQPRRLNTDIGLPTATSNYSVGKASNQDSESA